MPWKKHPNECVEEKFVRRRLELKTAESFGATCARFGVSRKTGYKWWGRLKARGIAGVRREVRRPRCAWQAVRWRQQVRALARRYRFWGGRKLRLLLPSRTGRPAPSARTIERWLGPRLRVMRRGRGPRLPALVRTRPDQSNAVWTIDFKGWFRTQDGARIDPLTVRDLYSRFILLIRDGALDYRTVRRAMTRLFRRHGLPRAIWCDNGPPFGGEGPLGLTRLSAWWVELGIRVEFSRPARPGDNPHHEHMHGELKNETARPPAANPRAQQRRFDRWRHLYNFVRPHEALADATPASRYRHRRRPLPRRIARPTRTDHLVHRVNATGWIRYLNRRRFIGLAFPGCDVVLLPRDALHCEIKFRSHLLGWLYFAETRIRPARYQPTVQCREGAPPPPSQPSPISSALQTGAESVTS